MQLVNIAKQGGKRSTCENIKSLTLNFMRISDSRQLLEREQHLAVSLKQALVSMDLSRDF